MEEVQALRALTDVLQDLELLESFKKDCGEHLQDETPQLVFVKSSGHTGYRIASLVIGEVLEGQIPRLLDEAIELCKLREEKARGLLKKAQK